MEQITVREFKAKASHYLKVLASGDYVNVKGLLLGRVTTGDYGKKDNNVVTDVVVTTDNVVTQEESVVTEKDKKFNELKKQLDVREMNVVTFQEASPKQVKDLKSIEVLQEEEQPFVYQGPVHTCELCGRSLLEVFEGLYNEETGDEIKVCAVCLWNKSGKNEKAYKQWVKKLKKLT